jgi:hypothetical protein
LITRPGHQKSSYWTGFWNNRRWIHVSNRVFLNVKINFLYILSLSSASEITSKLRTLAMFVIVDLQTVFCTCCLGMFMICVANTMLMPSPIFDVALQFDHCLEGSNGFGHTIYRNLPQLFVSEYCCTQTYLRNILGNK